MKKTYIQPATQVMTVAMTQMICGSNDLSVGGTTSSKGDLLSRESYSDWGDDED